jgi:alkanesulfonate monooxygenase SsuD/methylene tetrahydromethanopterin reductase-like flavin-dependent oxidoreductase (luciferase family)
VARYLTMYRDQARDFGYEAEAGQLGWAAPIYVAETDERAIEEARAGAESLFNQYLAMPWEMLLPPGYMSLESMKRTMAMRAKSLGAKPGSLTIEDLVASGTVVAGSPQTVRDRIARMKERTGLGILVCMLQFGVMGDELAKRNMAMFASEVMPHFRG